LHRQARRDWVNAIAMAPFVSGRWRRLLLLVWGVRARYTSISPGCYFGGPNIRIGYGTRLNRGVYIDNNAPVEIGQWCNLAMQTMIVTATHQVGPSDRRAGPGIAYPVRIGNGCWLGARVLVLPGVTIGDGCVIAAGAVVTKDCAPNGLYVGSPARRIRDLPLDGAR
jgi:maltose O-acetyltransferase